MSDLRSRTSAVDEWTRLGTSLHTGEALRALRAADRSIEAVLLSHPGCVKDIERARRGVREAVTALRRVHDGPHDDVPSAG